MPNNEWSEKLRSIASAMPTPEYRNAIIGAAMELEALERKILEIQFFPQSINHIITSLEYLKARVPFYVK